MTEEKIIALKKTLNVVSGIGGIVFLVIFALTGGDLADINTKTGIIMSVIAVIQAAYREIKK